MVDFNRKPVEGRQPAVKPLLPDLLAQAEIEREAQAARESEGRDDAGLASASPMAAGVDAVAGLVDEVLEPDADTPVEPKPEPNPKLKPVSWPPDMTQKSGTKNRNREAGPSF